MFREPAALGREVRRAAGRRVQHHARDPGRVGVDDDRAADAAAHEVRALDAELVEERDSLPRVVGPGDPLDSPAGLARLALVERDTGEVPLEPVEEAQPLVDPEGRPVLERAVEAAGGEEQQRRAVAAHLVAGLDPVAGRGRH